METVQERNESLGQSLFMLAEEFNRAEYHEIAYDLKGIFIDFTKKLTDEENDNIKCFLESVGA